MDLPVPEGQKKDKSFASHSTMSKSFGLQRKTLARVIGLEKRVDKIESGSGGINIDKFTELNKGIVSVNNNLKAIGDALTAELVADKEAARDEKNKNKREVDALKKGKAEKFLELEETKKVVKPVEKVKETAKTIFQRLFDALSAVFAGWLLDKGGKMLTAWGDGDMETFNKMKDEIVKSLAVVGGLLLAVNLVGIIGAMKMIVAGLKIGVPAILGLLANPWTWVVLGIGVAAYFGYKHLDKTITGGGDFKKFDSSLREHTENLGLDVKNFNTGGLILGDDNKHITVPMFGKDSITGKEWQPGDGNKNAQTKLNVMDPTHKDYIIQKYGKEQYDTWVDGYNRYQNLMKVKEDMVGEMNSDIEKQRKEFYKNAREESKKLKEAGVISGANWKKISLTGAFDTSAGKWWSMQDQLWKAKELEIRAKYHKRLRIEFPELFDDDLATIPDFKREIDGHGAIGDTEIKKYEKKLEKMGFDSDKYEMKIVDGELKILRKENNEVIDNNEVKIDGNSSSSNLNNGIDFKTAVELGSQVNNEKINSISSTLLDSDNNFEFVPFEQAIDTDTDFGSDMNLGDASEIPTLYTGNIGNEYRFFYSHVYQQGND